jgi:hypothetical protein
MIIVIEERGELKDIISVRASIKAEFSIGCLN